MRVGVGRGEGWGHEEVRVGGRKRGGLGTGGGSSYKIV